MGCSWQLLSQGWTLHIQYVHLDTIHQTFQLKSPSFQKIFTNDDLYNYLMMVTGSLNEWMKMKEKEDAAQFDKTLTSWISWLATGWISGAQFENRCDRKMGIACQNNGKGYVNKNIKRLKCQITNGQIMGVSCTISTQRSSLVFKFQ